MKIILTEHQLKYLIKEELIVNSLELNEILKKLKNKGYLPTSNIGNIYDHIDKLPKGTYEIVKYDGYDYKQIQDGLWNELNSRDYQSSDRFPLKFAIYKKIKMPDNKERYYGIGFIFLQKDVTSDRQSEFDTTPPESHGGK